MKKILRTIFVFLYLMFVFSCISTGPSLKKQDRNIIYSHIIILRNGNEYRGVLKSIDENTIVFEVNGNEMVWDKKDVDRLQFHRRRMYENINKIDQVEDKEISAIWESSKKWEPSQDTQIVVLFDKTVIEFMSDNEVLIRNKQAMKILNEEGKKHSTQYFYYLKGISEAKLLYGITILSDGSVKSIEGSAVNDEPINNQFPQYDMLRRIKFGLKDVDVGSTFIWESEVYRKFDQIKNPFLFEKELISYNNIVSRKIEIIAPKNMQVNYSIYPGLIPFENPVVKKEKAGLKTIYSFEQKNIKGYINDEESTPSSSLVYPKFYASLNNNWEQLSSQYYKKYFETPVNSSIKKLANDITGKEKDDKKKLVLLYDYVNRSKNKANISMGQFSFSPLDESKILKLSALNILDKSYLFTRMARSLNIPVKLFFYRRNSQHNIADKIVSLKQFDSVICESLVDGKPLFFSFENQNFGIGQTANFVSDAVSLELTKKESSIDKLRTIPLDYNKYEYIYECSLKENNTMKIKRTTKIFGSNEASWRTKRFLSNEELDKFMESSVGNIGNDVTLESYRFINDLGDFNKPIIVEENILVKNYSFSSGKNTKLFKIPELRFSSGTVSKDKRNLPYYIGSKYVDIYKLKISFPDRYKVAYIPGSIRIKKKDFSFLADYKVKDNNITIDIRSDYLSDMIEVPQYKELKDCIEQKTRLTSEWIMLGAAE